jgi:hypothetical protein
MVPVIGVVPLFVPVKVAIVLPVPDVARPMEVLLLTHV